MNEKLDWFNWGREKNKLMSEALENAGQAVENLRGSNFRYKDLNGEIGIKKEFNWSEFAPKGKDGKSLLSKIEVLEALGIGPNPKIEEAPQREDTSGRELRGIWPTLVPGLNYIRIRNLDVAGYMEEENDYFQIGETQSPVTYPRETQNIAKKKKKSNADWSKQMWSQPGADKLADREITEDIANYGPDRNK